MAGTPFPPYVDPAWYYQSIFGGITAGTPVYKIACPQDYSIASFAGIVGGTPVYLVADCVGYILPDVYARGMFNGIVGGTPVYGVACCPATEAGCCGLFPLPGKTYTLTLSSFADITCVSGAGTAVFCLSSLNGLSNTDTFPVIYTEIICTAALNGTTDVKIVVVASLNCLDGVFYFSLTLRFYRKFGALWVDWPEGVDTCAAVSSGVDISVTCEPFAASGDAELGCSCFGSANYQTIHFDVVEV